MKILTNYWFKPIPTNRFDWSAVTEDYDGAEDSHDPVGYGATEAEAVRDLWREIGEREDDKEPLPALYHAATEFAL